MLIHVVNPNSSREMTASIEREISGIAMPGVQFLVTGAAIGPSSIEGPHDAAQAVPHMLAEIGKAKARKPAAHVIACFDDTGLDAARFVCDVPVIGIGAAACHFACLTGERFSIITSVRAAVPTLRANLRRNGLESQCSAIRSAECPVLEIEKGSQGARDAIRRQVQAALEEDEIDRIVLGCAGMARMAERLGTEFDCEIVEPIRAGVACAAAAATIRRGVNCLSDGPVQASPASQDQKPAP